jgi:hypothetical protein
MAPLARHGRGLEVFGMSDGQSAGVTAESPTAADLRLPRLAPHSSLLAALQYYNSHSAWVYSGSSNGSVPR